MMRPVIGATGLVLALAGAALAAPAGREAARRAPEPPRGHAAPSGRAALGFYVQRLFSPAAIPLLRKLGRQCWNAQRWIVDTDTGQPRVEYQPLKDPLFQALSDFDPGATSTGMNGALISDLLAACATESRRGFAPLFRQRYGPRASRLLDALAELPAPRGKDASITRERLELFGSPDLLHLLRGGQPVSAPKMASFDRLVERTARRQPLAGFRVLAVQHLLGTTGSLMRAIAASGARPQDVWLFAKKYSENLPVQLELTHLGFQTYFSDDSPTRDARLLDSIRRQIAGAPPGTRFLVLDDGGHLLRLINDRLPELADRIVGVEQTRRGAMLLRQVKLRFPVINVAESWAKLAFESPLIGRSVGQSVVRRLGRLRQDGFDPGRKILVVGYGAVGRATALYLRGRGYAVEVFDDRAEARALADDDRVKVHATKEAALREARIVVSATGALPFDVADIERLPNRAVLINAGSQDSEYSAAVRRLVATRVRVGRDERRHVRFGGVTLDLGNVDGHAQQDEILRTPDGKQHLFVFGGDVINFDGRTDPIPARYIQLTRGLLYLGLVQAASEHRPGLRALALKPQRRLVQAIETELRARGESLSAPRF